MLNRQREARDCIKELPTQVSVGFRPDETMVSHPVPTLNHELGYPCCDTIKETLDSFDNSEESRLPPPMPYFDRRTHAAASAPTLMQTVLSRARSSSPRRGASDTPKGEEMRQARAMTQSMPNLYSSRSMHNRGLGYSVLSKVSECGVKQGEKASLVRVQEFETLLEGL
jgi:hypothetical protein